MGRASLACTLASAWLPWAFLQACVRAARVSFLANQGAPRTDRSGWDILGGAVWGELAFLQTWGKAIVQDPSRWGQREDSLACRPGVTVTLSACTPDPRSEENKWPGRPSVLGKLERLVKKPLYLFGDNCKKTEFVTVASGEENVLGDRQRDILIVQGQPLASGLALSCSDNRIISPTSRHCGRRLPALTGHICHCSHASVHRRFSSSGGQECGQLA